MRKLILPIMFLILSVMLHAKDFDLKAVIQNTSANLKQLRSLSLLDYRIEFEIVSEDCNGTSQPITNVLHHESNNHYKIEEINANGRITIGMHGDTAWRSASGRIDSLQSSRIREATEMFRWFDASTAIEYLENESNFEVLDMGIRNVGGLECRLLSFAKPESADTVHFLIRVNDCQLVQSWLSIGVSGGRSFVKFNYTYSDPMRTGVANEVLAEHQTSKSVTRHLYKSKCFTVPSK